jgi:hypothetical protein
LSVLDVGSADGPGARLRRAAIAHSLSFEVWRSLAREGLTDDEAADLMVQLVEGIA